MMAPEGYFDFESVEEEPQNSDFSKQKLCAHCKKPIPQEAQMCLYCGEEAEDSRRPSWVIWTACLLIVAFGIFFVFFL